LFLLLRLNEEQKECRRECADRKFRLEKGKKYEEQRIIIDFLFDPFSGRWLDVHFTARITYFFGCPSDITCILYFEERKY
jgi:hypothetical protein